MRIRARMGVTEKQTVKPELKAKGQSSKPEDRGGVRHGPQGVRTNAGTTWEA